MTDQDALLRETLDRLVSRTGSERSEWNDVLDRAKRARAQRNLGVGAAAAFCAFALLATAFAYAPRVWDIVAGNEVDRSRLGPDERIALAIGTSGRGLTPPERARLKDEPLLNVKSVRLIAQRGRYTFYVIDLSDQRCFAFGRIGDWRLFGTPVCPALTGYEFPTREHPVLDRSVVEVTRDKPNPHIFLLQGFAADIVKEVALQRANRELVSRTPVRGNVYLRSTGLPEDSDTIVALDASGKQLWSNCPPVRPNSDEEGC